METQLFLPPYLQKLGYETFPAIDELCQRSVIIQPNHIDFKKGWFCWHGIFDYISCVEFARNQLHALPNGRDILISDDLDVFAKYHSASLIFFARATLDNIAVWLADTYNLDVRGGDCAFHKAKFINCLRDLDIELAKEVEEHKSFIEDLEAYRQEWIHRLSGGARVFSDKSPQDPVAKVEIAVPINPAINFEGDNRKLIHMAEKCKQKNKGRWLYGIDEFADIMANGTRDLLINILQRVLLIDIPK